ncbi:hypothetical protein [Roseovarius rhodophyticola]|uniref:MARVEL domain-containing protein n=1 Tax=Roseovarius rhodophyticola TaxID=3080827 RepID=A0ABZ2TKD9_9RHOB|nr:hypothetical protein [Roseovarius sp. W115]
MDWYRASIQTTRELGLYAIKTMVTLNSGAFVVMLTFLGNAAAQTAFFLPLAAIKASLFCFLVGIVLALIVILTAYIVALTSNPYTGKAALPDWATYLGYFGFSFASVAAFIFGVWTVVSKVQAL